jgi:hypothetical protein
VAAGSEGVEAIEEGGEEGRRVDADVQATLSLTEQRGGGEEGEDAEGEITQADLEAAAEPTEEEV